jgi:hypothetical protein
MDGSTLCTSTNNDKKKPKRLRNMKVLIACETSGRTRRAFQQLGHETYSCDLEPAEDGDEAHHFQCDVLTEIDFEQFDLMIAHPPCTYLCNSGVHWLWEKNDSLAEDNRVIQRFKDLELARQFFMALWNAPIPKICIENPVPHKYANLPKYSQTIQPYMFGDDASKRTCLWLKGLSKLTIPSPDLWKSPRVVNGLNRWGNQTDSGQNRLGPSETRASERSRTYGGIANAFASNWG